MLLEDGEEIARAEPPPVDAVDGTAAGDAFTACLLVSLLRGPRAARRRCAAPAPPARSPPPASARSLPCRRPTRSTAYSARDDSGHPRLRSRARRCDRAPARAREPRDRPRRRHHRRTATRRSTRRRTTRSGVLALVDRDDVPVADGAERPLVRELHVAAHVHGESGLDGPELPAARLGAGRADAVDFLVDHVTPETVLVRGRAADERRAQALERGMRPRPHRADGRRHRRGEHDSGGRVQHLGRS